LSGDKYRRTTHLCGFTLAYSIPILGKNPESPICTIQDQTVSGEAWIVSRESTAAPAFQPVHPPENLPIDKLI
jgi:hypothetical protein